MNLAVQVFKSLEAEKPKYKYVYYSPKKERLFCVKGVYQEVNSKDRPIQRWVDCYGGDLWGTQFKIEQCEDWVYVGSV